jgi:hypothetical protein
MGPEEGFELPELIFLSDEVLELEDAVPDNMEFTGEDMIITLDLRTIEYKKRAMKEILDPEFKSY